MKYINDTLESLRARPTIDVASAAELLGVSPSTLYRWAREGQLPGAMRLGLRVVRIRTAEFFRLLDDGQLVGNLSPNQIVNDEKSL